MTIPHLMNCSHSESGWCLDCVKELWEENQELQLLVNQYPEYEESEWSGRIGEVTCYVCGASSRTRSGFKHRDDCLRGKYNG